MMAVCDGDAFNAKLRSELRLEWKEECDMENISVRDGKLFKAHIKRNEKKEERRESPEKQKIFLDTRLLWNLHLQRKDAFKVIDDKVEDLVNLCLRERRELYALDDSNRGLQKELRNTRAKYEAMLEKNKKDTGIIIALKDSEGRLRQAKREKEETKQKWLDAGQENKAIAHRRIMREMERGKMLFMTQTSNINLGKINERFKRMQNQFEKQVKIGEEDDSRHAKETWKLQSSLARNTGLLEDLQEYFAEREDVVKSLQENIERGLRVDSTDAPADSLCEGKAPSEESESSPLTMQQAEETVSCEDTDVTDAKIITEESAAKAKWLESKALLQVSEQEKKHLTWLYYTLNQRMIELNNELTDARRFVLDKEAEKQDLLRTVKKLEEIVYVKRRKITVPPRCKTVDLDIRIETKRKQNEMLRKFAIKCFNFWKTDFKFHKTFMEGIKDIFLNSLLENEPKEEQEGDSKGEDIADEETKSQDNN